MFGAQDVAARTILMLGGAGTFMGRVLAVRVMMGAIRAMSFLVTFLVAMMTDDDMRGWIQGGCTSGVGSHCPMTSTVETTVVASGASSMKARGSGG